MSAMKKEREVLEKNMGQGAIWAVAVGSIIGWGCFVQGANWTENAGGPAPVFAGLVVGGLLMMIIGLSYSYMIAKLPVAGGEFAYAYKGFGGVAAYICGWMLSLGYLAIVALNATALPLLANFIFPRALKFGYLWNIAGYDIYMGECLLSLSAILIFGILNYRGVKQVGNAQLLIVVILCVSVIACVAGVIATGNFHVENLQPASGYKEVSFFAGFIAVVSMAPWLYVGFDCIPQAAEEYNFPPEKSKKLLLTAIVSGMLLYCAMVLVTNVVIPWTEVKSLVGADGQVVSWFSGAVLEIAMGKIGIVVIAIAVIMGILSGINGFYLSSSRLIFSMARAKMLPKWFGKIHPKYRTPSNCILVIMLVCMICPFFGREVINWVVDMCSVGTSVGYFFTCAGAIVVLKMAKSGKDKVKLNPIVAYAGALIAVIILALLLLPFSPAFMSLPSFIALGIWILLGALFFLKSYSRFSKLSKEEADYAVLGDEE